MIPCLLTFLQSNVEAFTARLLDMALRKNGNISLKTLVLILCLLLVEVVISNFCTAGAGYKYCHEVQPYGLNVIQRYKEVYTVHECREFCDRIGCFAFDYEAGAAWKLQLCRIFYGTYEFILLSPSYRQCDDETWFFCWKRPIENPGRNCMFSGNSPEPLQEQAFGDLENVTLANTANSETVGLTTAVIPANMGLKTTANPVTEGLTTSANPKNEALTTAANSEKLGSTTTANPENAGLTMATNPGNEGLTTAANSEKLGSTTTANPENAGLTIGTNPGNEGLTTAANAENEGSTTTENPEKGLTTATLPVTDVDKI